ncbi:lactonase family protein [Massilia sp. IC2-477]|uniref:lactonase family protein n=1 Tax=Massilia sp. IC2-477 TaxID=2887198 RepID=UPI001D0FB17C|nr:lactonase family protein [Massilia sp. IC2-477]MCC2957528.1 lactonase family protein [Massilia sp. IC2-477]
MTRFFQRVLTMMALSAALLDTSTVAQAAPPELIYVGTQAGEIRALRFDPADGRMAPLGAVARDGAPTWTAVHPRLPVLYAVNDNKAGEGSINAYAVDRATGGIKKIDEAPAGGAGTTYLALDAGATTLFAANFGGGSASSIAIEPDGSLGALVSTIKATGSGPHRRQASAHAHSVTLDPSGRYGLVPDLGADRVFVYAFDRASRSLAPDDTRTLALAPGSGPRQLVFGADGRHAYLMNELTAQVQVLRWDAEQGRLAAVQAVPLSSQAFQGTRSGSAIAISPDGRYLYAANRGEHELQVFRVHPDSGELTLVQRIASGGQTPWGFALHPSGKWLAVAHQRSNTVNLFSIDPASGQLANTGQAVEAPTPVSISFLK